MSELKRVRIVGSIEACSAIALFLIAMPMKYLADMPKVVTYVGGLHGLLWIAYLLVVSIAFAKGKLSGKWVGILGFLSLVPFGPLLVDGRLKKRENELASSC